MGKYIRKIENEIHIGNWYTGWHSWIPKIVYEECGYEKGNAELTISLFGWHSLFRLPWKSKRYPNGDCDSPRYGFAIHDNSFWIYTGGNGNLDGGSTFKTFDLPFTYSVPCCRHQVECDRHVGGIDEPKLIDYKDMECKDNGKGWKPIHEVGLVVVGKDYYTLQTYHYDFTDKYDNTIVPCTFWVEEREWRPKWLGWTGLFKKVKRYIEIVFQNEVGSKKDTWKGGVIGCSYRLLPNETPMECIKRMERDRNFR